jgi:hypothetical protein
MSCRIPFVNRMALVHALAKVSIELIEYIMIKSNYFQNAQKDVRALLLQNHPKSIRTSARRSISRTSASK